MRAGRGKRYRARKTGPKRGLGVPPSRGPWSVPAQENVWTCRGPVPEGEAGLGWCPLCRLPRSTLFPWSDRHGAQDKAGGTREKGEVSGPCGRELENVVHV